MKINKINIKTNTKNYSILIGRNLINKIDKILKDNNITFEKCLIVTDKNIPNKFKKTLFKKLKSKKIFKIELVHQKKIKIIKQLKKFIKFYLKKDLTDQIVLFLLVEE